LGVQAELGLQISFPSATWEREQNSQPKAHSSKHKAQKKGLLGRQRASHSPLLQPLLFPAEQFLEFLGCKDAAATRAARLHGLSVDPQDNVGVFAVGTEHGDLYQVRFEMKQTNFLTTYFSYYFSQKTENRKPS
jgi:hypothetical protein